MIDSSPPPGIGAGTRIAKPEPPVGPPSAWIEIAASLRARGALGLVGVAGTVGDEGVSATAVAEPLACPVPHPGRATTTPMIASGTVGAGAPA